MEIEMDMCAEPSMSVVAVTRQWWPSSVPICPSTRQWRACPKIFESKFEPAQYPRPPPPPKPPWGLHRWGQLPHYHPLSPARTTATVSTRGRPPRRCPPHLARAPTFFSKIVLSHARDPREFIIQDLSRDLRECSEAFFPKKCLIYA